MAGVEGRVALITGGSRGIGRATADILASRGARVMCIARNRQELEATGHDYSLADLGTPEGCAQAVADTEQRLGPIEIFICNHGIGSAHERVVWEERAALNPAKRVATPQEVAEMIAFLATEESSGVSGEAIKVALGSQY